VAYVTAEARQEMLRNIAEAIDEIGAALGVLGSAYELLDEHTADTLEEQLFRPVQLAYGRAKRTHSGFAERHGLAGRTFAPGSAGPASSSARELIETAVEAIEEADALLGDLQDSMRPVEVGDAELRAGLAEVRTLLGRLPARARRLESVLGR
jgi:hypothetical protein